MIIAEANSGSIKVDGAVLTALRGIKFDHQRGTVQIGDAVISATVLVTGGTTGASGQTTIGPNTKLKTPGTGVEVGEGCGIHMVGGASIKQVG